MKTFATAVLVALLLAACAHDATHVTYRMDVDEGYTRRITHVADGVSRTISMDGPVTFVDGVIASIDPGVTLVFEELEGGASRRGEVRSERGEPVVYVEDGGELRPADGDERAWFAEFLAAIGIDDGEADDDERLAAEAADASVAVRDVIERVPTLSFESDRIEVLMSLARRDALTSAEQVALVDAAFRLGFESNKVELLETLIARDDFAPAARERIVERGDEIGFDSDRARIYGLLLRRDG